MTRLEIASCCTLVAFAALSTSAAAAPKKPTKPAATPAASAAPSASTPAPPPAPAPSATTSTTTSDDAETVHAEATPSGGDKKFTVGADLLFVLPVGNMSDYTGPQIGPLLRAGLRVIPQLEVTARIGYLFAFNASQTPGYGLSGTTNLTNIPLWLGARYFLTEAPAGLYGAAEVGMNFLTGNATINGVSKSTGDTRAGFNLGVGYVLSKDLPIDIRLQYSYFNLIGENPGVGALMGLGLSAGYSFFF